MLEFPSIFYTGILYQGWTKRSLCADGLAAWACCMAGEPPTPEFGNVMALISEKLGIPATPENLSDYADNILNSEKP